MSRIWVPGTGKGFHAPRWALGSGALGIPGSLPFRLTVAGRKLRRKRVRRPVGWAFVAAIFITSVFYEVRTSTFQSWFFHHFASQMTYTLGTGASSSMVYPRSGPFDLRHGYTRLPEFQNRLERGGFQIESQARFSPQMARFARWGISPPYAEAPEVGLTISSADGSELYSAVDSSLLFQSYDQIPPLMANALLVVENRELGHAVGPHTSPVMEWSRLAKAGLSYAGIKLGLPLRLEGGSTLATQMEKYRHSPEGKTDSASEKMRQMVSASLKAYRQGTLTTQPRHDIILSYLNTIPLGAAPGFGEVHGIGEGLLVWFHLHLDDVIKELSSPAVTPAKVKVFKNVLSLLCAVRAPTHYLSVNHAALEARTNYYIRVLAGSGVIDRDFARRLESQPITFAGGEANLDSGASGQKKTVNAIRNTLMNALGVDSYYDLDHLHLGVHSTIDAPLQNSTLTVFEDLRNRDYLKTHGLTEDRLLSQGDPERVLYSVLLFERLPQENVLRVQLDNLDKPFDLNDGMKLQLGSTAKLRTLAHYLEIVESLWDEMSPLDAGTLRLRAASAQDPITRWAAETLGQFRPLSLDGMLSKALERSYSASPYEAFYTGGGIHRFRNFDPKDNGRVVTVREATRQSINLAYIRLMRDLVRFHEARLPYDAVAVLRNPADPARHKLLEAAADDEGSTSLGKAYKEYNDLSYREIISRLLGSKRSQDHRRLAILFYAWRGANDADDGISLLHWIDRFDEGNLAEIPRLMRAYGNPYLTLADYAFLLGVEPLHLWCAGELFRNPEISWNELYARSVKARKESSAWLFKARNRRAQDIRLRIWIEQDAFAQMTRYWQRLGFPFQKLIPSLATALGDSSDTPSALAQLMGIILNDGVRKPVSRISTVSFAEGTPYQTTLSTNRQGGERVMSVLEARTLREVLQGVVDTGTARRLAGAFNLPDGTKVVVGGKTGSGDNQLKAIDRNGSVISSRAVNRTATFVFYIGDRYFGVITAFVDGPQAQGYKFTSALPVTILKLLAPAIKDRLAMVTLPPQPLQVIHNTSPAILRAGN